ncbi:hypothetical protein [Amycolatopsis thermophila]|uniref:Uncharacterized protein n=1 Tax=Amycolatopsis thermophila TaxID=206084 RepID=A0ABU0F2Y5_9PSEU|nr:hypothetical protein [Amycolatopsis thermophila]MDQ0381896.1 hypothetical protein [Amycolatopsis thermophila]
MWITAVAAVLQRDDDRGGGNPIRRENIYVIYARDTPVSRRGDVDPGARRSCSW